MQRHQTLFLLSALLSIVLFAWYLQNNLALAADVYWWLTITARFLAGGNYANDFFETNPPLLLYVSMPPAFFIQWTQLSPVLVMRLYVFLLAFLSLFLCNIFLRRLYSTSSTFLYRAALLLTLAVIFLILPMQEFAQREHLILILVMPYFFLMAVRLEKTPVNQWLATLTGCLAGVGFAIKPFFLITPFIIELYFFWKRRNCFRPETISLMAMLILYLAIIVILHNDYLTIVMPYAMRRYYSGMTESLLITLAPYTVSYCFLIIFYFFLNKKNNNALSTILCFALCSFLFLYIIQYLPWYYHVFPAFSLAILLGVWLLTGCLTAPIEDTRSINKAFLFFLPMASLFVFFYMSISGIKLIFSPFLFFGFFAALFFLAFLKMRPARSFFYMITWVIVIIASSAAFSYLIGRTVWYAHALSITLLFMFLLVVLATVQQKNQLQIIICLFTVFFILAPVVDFSQNLYLEHKKKLTWSPLSTFIKNHPSYHSAYLLSTATSSMPAISEAGMKLVSRFPLFWMIPGLIKGSDTAADKKFLINMVTDDLQQKMPDIVFVDVSDKKSSLSLIPFNFITFFSEDTHFRQAWQAYAYVTTIQIQISMVPYRVYKLAVYQRRQPRLA